MKKVKRKQRNFPSTTTEDGCQIHCFEKAAEIDDYHDAGHDLADDGGQGGAGHSHTEAEDEQWIQDRVEDGSG